MADFIAVIRRAVDGLSDNTPEMRIRVYDRARSAVQRQLDNMKPRPADDVIARQLEKLDEAIATIEREFSGAPAAEAAAPEPSFVEEVAPPPPAPPEPEPVPEPVHEPEPEPAPRYVAPEPVAPEPPAFLKREPAPAVVERVEPKPVPVYEPKPEPKFEPAPTPIHAEPVHVEPAPIEQAADEPEDAPDVVEDDTMPPPAAETDTSWQRDRFDEPLGRREPQRPVDLEWEPPVEPLRRETAFGSGSAFGFDPTPAPRPAEPVTDPWTPVVTDNPFHEPAEIFTPKTAPEPVARRDDPFSTEKPKAANEQKSWWDEVEAAPVPPMPSAMPSSTAREASWDTFEAFVGERSTGKPVAEATPAKPPRGRDGMSIGQQEPPREIASEAPAREEREGRGKLIAGIAAALILLGGAGYAGWRFSDSILGLVNGTSSTSSQTASKSQPATGQQSPATATQPAGGTTAPAATPAVTGPQKFTQRLMADGSETDSGTSGEQVASAAQAEGKSVANQNEKPPAQPTPAQTPAAQQPATTTPAATTQTDTASSQQSAPVKMFLYEERLGQASPTALEGTVTWSVKPDDQDGKKGKMIQGDISVPGRKMSAIFTLRKNNDPTLPASHIIELTFSLPKEFEGRGIESVLRISMKDKEQEQGDPLVAVPAKITDYFHMIALNAFADAVKTNLNLLKSRDWMDVPVTYSNGRRALLTLQKGPDGQRVFDEVISSWQASGDGAAPAPATPPAQ
ncbi:hypothetical protein [Rhizobium sp. C4]|uniref:hypothetical protein n=1 Tax=Rhizobium sp. C4 TaxID=1349800 RepID=UPI001E623BC4|nr:hypothetical protein [Rhizobium sp. C4]MCD2174216.1 hypothetical protein [Rhizobium sp. C4]